MEEVERDKHWPDDPRDIPSASIEAPVVPEDIDAWDHPRNLPIVQAVIQMRLYDALMGVLTYLDREGAQKLINAHAAGKIVGPFPAFIPDMEEEDNG